jgi:hypothetical protein
MSFASRGRSLGTLAGLLAAPLVAQQGTYVLRSGKDTVAVERFTRSAGRLEGESFVPMAGAHQKFVAELTPDLGVTRITNQYWMMSDSAGRPPRQTATISFVGDSAIAVIASGGKDATQRFAIKAGALPYMNPSVALISLLIERARRANLAEVPVFIVGGGVSLIATVKPLGGDSVSVTMSGGEMRLVVDAAGWVKGGSMGNNITVELATGPVKMAVEKPDYSAPGGAPYTAESVIVPTPMGHQLGGTLTLPKSASKAHPVPAIITITGSGLEDRDEAIPMFKGYRPFRQIADTLGRRGIAVLRMDDRGFGESGGDGGKATTADFAQDIRAGLAYLRTRPEIDGNRLGLVGHSEGGIIAPLVAKQEPTLKGIVLLAGTAYTGRRILTFQLRNGIQHDTSLTPAKRDSQLGAVPARIDSMAANQAWLKFFVDYDPTTTARQLMTPVLILNGANDQQVTPDQVAELEKSFKAAGNPDVTAKIFPDMNHLFVHDANGFPGAYTTLPSMKVEPEVLGTVADWLAKRLKAMPANP